MTSQKVGIVGAGLSGAVLARQLAEHADVDSIVFETRDHIGGNCHTRRDEKTGVLVHEYGPHIFNTVHEHVWNYLGRFTEFVPYVHRVKATTDRGVFGLPINLLTINQFFEETFTPREARDFVASLGDERIVDPQNFEEKALQMIGADLYETFFKGYTTKQWGRSPTELPASIFSRLPISFDYDDAYHFGRFTGIPRDGYTEMVREILDHPRVEVRLNETATPDMREDFAHLFWSGTIDGFFGYDLGRLRYRTVWWDKLYETGDIIGTAQMNFTSLDVPYTRITEHKYFAPWEQHDESIAMVEYSKETDAEDIPYYPLALGADKELFAQYQARAEALRNVSFIGRLGTYRYIDMDKSVDEMLRYAKAVARAIAEKNGRIPSLSTGIG